MSESLGDKQTSQSLLDRIHPSLRDSFVALPPLGTRLTEEQLHAIFGGDLRALRDLWALAPRNHLAEEEPTKPS